MPVNFPVETFFENTTNTATEFGEALRDGVVSFACNLWSSFPDFITEGTNPASSFARGFMNSACSPIQPAVPPPTPPFVGGQCETQYEIDVTFDFFPQFSSTPMTQTQNIGVFVQGPITDLVGVLISNDEVIRTTLVREGFPDTLLSDTSPAGIGSIIDGTIQYSVEREDGLPDICGNPKEKYNSPPPTINDLRQTTNITVNDGLDLALEIQYIQLSNQYNFPMNFKVNGVNVSLDIGGINIYAPDGFGSPSGGNDVPPPGSDPGTDGIGNDVTETFDENEYVVAPPSPVPRQATKLIEYLVCMDGVISTVTDTIKLGVGYSPVLTIIVDILGQILTDLCEMPEASLGLPEYYGLAPGADRPAIVYLWKIFTNGKWGASTYSSTVHHPTAQAIADLDTITNIQKTIGTHKTLIKLSDGSTIKATGITEAISQTNFDFLLDQVISSFVPVDVNANTIREVDTRLQVKTLTLRQVEYYPQGKKDNVPPTIKRIINP